ncbi:MAG TPA: SGNH hydrolase domain-containing protein [Acidimicrobiales bacterium]|nr:SGNH hydrolase domain-containing protein [Acidimicrobiales bacterium]
MSLLAACTSASSPTKKLSAPTALYSIACPAQNECIAVGQEGKVDVTNDRGKVWNVIQTRAKGRLLSVACLNQLECVAVGDNGSIVRSNDGGITWSLEKSNTKEELDGISCPKSGVCVVSGNLGSLYRSNDTGLEWKVAGSFDAALTAVSCFRELCAAPSLRTSLDSPATIFISNDLGESWIGQSLSQDRNFFGIQCMSTKSCMTVGDLGTVETTYDKGQTWYESTLGQFGGFHGVACPSGGGCLVGGDFGSIFRQYLGKWVSQAPNSASDSRQTDESIACTSKSACWVVGDQGTISATRDGGNSWKIQLRSADSNSSRVLLVGDSVAQTFGEEIPSIAEKNGLYFEDEGILGCGIAQGEPVKAGGQSFPEVALPCDGRPEDPQWPAYWTQYVAKFDPKVAVLLAGFWEVTDRFWNGQWANITQPAYQSYIQSQMQLAVNILSANGAQVVLLTSPYFDTGPYPEDDPSRVDIYNSLLRSVAMDNPGKAQIIDLNAFIDPGGKFAQYIGGVEIRQADGEHFSTQGSAYIAKWLLPQLAKIAS